MYMNNILVDNRVSEVLSVLTTVMSKANDLDDSYIVIYPNNHFYCISGETVIWHSILLSSIPDMNTIYIDTIKAAFSPTRDTAGTTDILLLCYDTIILYLCLSLLDNLVSA